MVSDTAIILGAHQCTQCPLFETRSNVVWGAGASNPKFTIIGEAPGFSEDISGLPFVGRSGDLLTFLLAEAGLSRDAVYITNTVKCRPPMNRDPMPREVEACRQWLDAELDLIQPQPWQILLLLGRFAARMALPHETATLPAGTARAYTFNNQPTIAIVSYHPAYALRDPSGRVRRDILRDIRRAKRYSEVFNRNTTPSPTA